MIRFIGQVTALVLTLTLLGWFWLLGYRTAPVQVDLTVPPELEPGQLFTGQVAATCDWYAYAQQHDLLDCQWRTYSFSYNPSTRVIRRTSLWMPHSTLTMGHLILAWGKPTGFQRGGLLVQVYWSKRRVYVIDRTFHPHSLVHLVVWAAEEQPDHWQGFTQARSR
jgi:hypothetical protein